MLPTRRIGQHLISAVGLGGARWALAPTPDTDLATSTLRAAIEVGVTIVDTAPAYTTFSHPGLGEELIGRVLRDALRAGEVLVTTKGGHWRDGNSFQIDARPHVLHRQCRESLTRLRVDVIDLYLLHWPDPKIELEESVGALSELRDQGLVRMVGVCNVSAEQLRRARSVSRIEAVQNRFSLLDSSDRSVLSACMESGIAYLAYSPLGGPTGSRSLSRLSSLCAVASQLGVSVQQVCLAWLLAQAPDLVPIVGAGSPASIESAASATLLHIASPTMADLAAAVTQQAQAMGVEVV